MTDLDSHPIPVIALWNNLLVPLQGDISDAQAEQLSQDVLGKIAERSHRSLVIDVSGLWLVDSHLCAVLQNLARAASLMGTPAVISGLRPEVALTLNSLGLELGEIETALSLEHALARVGVTPPPEDPPGWEELE
jgi:rsbT antagonist protein RsbS